MQYSTNNKLKLMEGTDNVKRQDFVDNFNIIDNGLSKFYVATLDSTNVYKVVTGNSLTSLNNGYSIRVAIPSNSTGAVSIIVDSVTVPVKKPNGNAVTNFKANGVYTLSYYNSVFTLASGGVDDVNFSAGDLLTGKNANNSDGEKVNGTMANNGAVTSTLTAGTSYTIPAGYHNGAGKITANSLASQTSATATTGQILSGQTAYVNGNKITGNMPNNGSSVQTVRSLAYDNKLIFRINEGYYGGSIYSDEKGQASVCEPLNYVADVLGITGDKILAGNNICGVNGTATIESLGGKKFFSGEITTTRNAGQTNEYECNIGFRPTTAMVVYRESTSSFWQDTWLHIRSTDQTYLTNAWREYNSSSSSSTDLSTQITSFTDNGLIFCTGQSVSTLNKDSTIVVKILAIG